MGDITYIRTRQGFLDLASRRVLGVSMASHMKASLVADALREAIGTRGGQVQGVVFHTDRGSHPGQYSSNAFGTRCDQAGIAVSMGRRGDAYDNAVAESFFATLETELLDRTSSRSDAPAYLLYVSGGVICP